MQSYFIKTEASDRAECCKKENVQPPICLTTCLSDDDRIMVDLMPGEPDSKEWEKLCPCSPEKNPGFAKCFPNLTLGKRGLNL